MQNLPSERDSGPKTAPTNEKLQKVLARAGCGSRRNMEAAISAGRVTVNGQNATLGDRVGPKDKINLDGRAVRLQAKDANATRVILYNKPEGKICSRSDPEGRPNVFTQLPPIKNGRWISIGRLDFNTSGLLLFTNNGELANKLMHPSSNIDREYLVRVQGEMQKEMLENLRRGVELEDGLARFTDIREGNKDSDSGNRWYYCVVMEGRNREVRRLWESQGLRVSRLKRVRFGNIFIPSHVRVGQWLELTEKDLAELYVTGNMTPPKPQKLNAKMQSEHARHQRKLREAGSRKKYGRVKKSARV